MQKKSFTSEDTQECLVSKQEEARGQMFDTNNR